MGLIQTFLALSSSPTFLLTFCITTALSVVVRRLYFHPLSHIPGPHIACSTSLFLYAISYLGIESRVIAYYHRKHKTRVLRVAPNSVSISDGSAIHNIYVAGGGFLKDSRYNNFD